jgi:hypothetical protein
MTLSPFRRVARLALLGLGLAAALGQAGCDPRPGNPPRPSDPDRTVPRPITGPAAASAASR